MANAHPFKDTVGMTEAERLNTRAFVLIQQTLLQQCQSRGYHFHVTAVSNNFENACAVFLVYAKEKKFYFVVNTARRGPTFWLDNITVYQKANRSIAPLTMIPFSLIDCENSADITVAVLNPLTTIIPTILN